MSDTAASCLPYADIFVGDSEMARLMRAHDWAATPLGPPDTWPIAKKGSILRSTAAAGE